MSTAKSSLHCYVFGCLVLSLVALPAQAQPPAAGNLTIQENVAQSFKVEPVVHRLQGHRGEVLKFEFQLSSLGKQAEVEVIPVNLRQEPSGIILPDLETPVAGHVRVLTQTEFTLREGSSETLQGEVTIPGAKTNFLTYGLLVREKTVQNDFKPATKPGQTQASVKFITQYLLRLDIETETATEGELKELKLENTELGAVNGLPMFQAQLINPTNLAFECRVNATLKCGNGSAKKPVPLVMQTRSGLQGDERTLVKIMPRSRLDLSAAPEQALSPGPGELVVTLMSGRREVLRAEKEVAIALENFPVLQAKFTQLGDNLIASPAAILLGQGKGEKHALPLTLLNQGEKQRTIRFEVNNPQGEPINDVQLSTSSVNVPSGKNHTVRVSFKSQKSKRETLHGFVHVKDDSQELARIPLTLSYGSFPSPQLEHDSLVLKTSPTNCEFALQVRNTGDGFFPLHARLEFFDSQGRTHSASAGYGKIMLPGTAQQLVFGGPILPPGDVAARLTLETFPGQPPLVINQEFKVADKPL